MNETMSYKEALQSYANYFENESDLKKVYNSIPKKELTKAGVHKAVNIYLKNNLSLPIIIKQFESIPFDGEATATTLASKFIQFFSFLNRYEYELSLEEANVIMNLPKFNMFLEKVVGNKKAVKSDYIDSFYGEDVNFKTIITLYLDKNNIEIVETDDQSISKVSTLTFAEEQKLFEALEKDSNNYEEYKSIIIEKNLPLVRFIASNFYYKRINPQGKSKIELDDVIQEGYFGLERAIKSFNYKLGFKFSTYAVNWIEHYVGRYYYNFCATIRKPVHLQSKTVKLKAIVFKFVSENNRQPSLEELSKLTGFSIKDIEIINKYQNDMVSLNSVVSEEHNDKVCLEDFIESPINVEKTALDNLSSVQTVEALKSILNEREFKIVFYRMGFYDGRVYTLEEIGSMMGVTRERIRQIESSALNKLRRNTYFKQLDDARKLTK